MLLYLSLNGIILSALLLYFNARKFPSTIYLSLFVFSISLYGFMQYVLLFSKSVFLTAIFNSHFTFILYLTGPSIYWYLRSVLSDNSRLLRKDLWHLAPMVIYILSAIPYFTKPFSEKIIISQEIIKDPGYLSVYRFSLLGEFFSNGLLFVGRPFLVLCYLLWTIVMFIRFLKRTDDLTVFSGQKFMIKWLAVFLGSSLVLVASHFVLMINTWNSDTSDLFFTFNTLQVLSVIGLIILLISPFFFPEVLYGMPRMPVQRSSVGNVPETVGFMDEGNTKYIQNFEADYLNQICTRIDQVMQNEQPYSQIDLNMARFSVMVSVPFSHLGYYFREVKKQSFNDFRNDWRIYHAKKLILEGKASGLTLEAIGIQSGFANRITFFRAFKRVEGIAPADFLAKMSQNSSSD